MNGSVQSETELANVMDESSDLGYNYNWAATYCRNLGNQWRIMYTDHTYGSLYCIKRPYGTGSNCNNCNTYRIVVWKNGGGESKHCRPRGWPSRKYNTRAGYIYPSHVSPCACDSSGNSDRTLGSYCDRFASAPRTTTTTSTTTTTTTKVYQVKMQTWVFPEFISWKITRGRKTMCKGSGYNQWYAKVSWLYVGLTQI